MEVQRMKTKISLAELEQAFAISDEDLNKDMSVIRISMIRDVHDDSIELYVLVYGQENSEDDAPVAELRMDPYAIGCEEELQNGGVEPSRLRAIFSPEVLSLITGNGVPVQWLGEDGAMMTVSLVPGDDNGIRLLPVEQ